MDPTSSRPNSRGAEKRRTPSTDFLFFTFVLFRRLHTLSAAKPVVVQKNEGHLQPISFFHGFSTTPFVHLKRRRTCPGAEKLRTPSTDFLFSQFFYYAVCTPEAPQNLSWCSKTKDTLNRLPFFTVFLLRRLYTFGAVKPVAV